MSRLRVLNFEFVTKLNQYLCHFYNILLVKNKSLLSNFCYTNNLKDFLYSLKKNIKIY